MGLVPTEITKIGIMKNLNDMQGPCDIGFHIPTNTELTALYNIGVNLGVWSSSNGNGLKTYIKMPFAGYRDYPNGNVSGHSSTCFCFSCIGTGNNGTAYALYFASNYIGEYTLSKCVGAIIRPFKDEVVIPDSTWTVLYQGTGDAGIYHNSTLGLISLSSDGTTWITIADKNCGATTVYNDGDTLAESNCGKYYQRGNNYGFSWTGSITKSSTKINASSYGPGNYYSSSKFITSSSAPHNWDTSDNQNLRGGVTQQIGLQEVPIKTVSIYKNGVDVLVRPPVPPKTFTISWTEQSNMSSGWTYSDDAAGLTAGSGDFDDFFGYSAVLLNTSGVETAEMKQSGGVFTGAMTTLGNITSGDNVMIKFPARGIKMTKSGSVVKLSITDDLTKESEGYQYYAFQTGTLASPGTIKDKFYLGAYKGYYGYYSSDKLKSWSGQTPSSNSTQSAFYTAAKSNGAGYDIMGFYQRMYINALYIMKYGNPNAKTTVGKGYIGGSSVTSTGGTNSQTNATYGTASTTTQCRLFGLEDRWGNINEWLGGCYTDSTKKLYTMLNGWSGGVSGGEATGTTINRTSSYYCMSAIAGNNKAMFAPITTINNSSYTTYYCSFIDVYGSCLATAGGRWSDNNMVNAFMINFGYAAAGKGTNIGGRLMYMDGLT